MAIIPYGVSNIVSPDGVSPDGDNKSFANNINKDILMCTKNLLSSKSPDIYTN